MTSTEQKAESSSKRARTGVVRSISGDRTANVVVRMLVKHPQYGKYVQRQTKLAVDCPGNDVGVGDLVEIVPCRRLSKTKAWRLTKVVRRYEAR